MLGAIDEAMAIYQSDETSDEDAVANLLADLHVWCAEHGVNFDAALTEANKQLAA